jgi:CO/xanthine dehydrogenase Mo-binding subunit
MGDHAGINGDRKVFSIVGKPNIPGSLSYPMATGKAKFGSDVVVPDMLHAKFLRSPYGHARIRSVDSSKAKALPGVVDIVTWDDPDIKAISFFFFTPKALQNTSSYLTSCPIARWKTDFAVW